MEREEHAGTGFRGEFFNRIDAKGRVSVPARFIRIVAAGDTERNEGEPPSFVLVWGMYRQHHCLDCYSMSEMRNIERRIAAMPYGKARTFMEMSLLRRSVDVSIDSSGRIVLPPVARETAGLDGTAVFAGMSDRFQIWTPETFEAQSGQGEEWFEGLSEVSDPMELLNLAGQG